MVSYRIDNGICRNEQSRGKEKNVIKEEMIEDDIELENSEELDQLEYTEETDEPIFSSVKVTKKDFSIFELHRKFKQKKLILDVDFQRKSVWSPKQKCELIESILMGLPLPIFYFKQQDNATYVVVDGKQRLTALFEYLDNEFVLKGLKILTFLNGKKFKDLVEEYSIYQTQLEDYQVYSHVILPPTPDKILFGIFDRVNRGGTKLNKQEIRNALYHGKGLDCINEITESDVFITSTGINPEKDKRMKGSYLITRFLAFYLLFKDDVPGEYGGNIDDLLEKTLTVLNKMEDPELNKIKKMVEELLEKAYDIGGRGAYRKDMNPSNPINMNIFESTLYYIYLIKNKKNYANNELLRKELQKLITDEQFLQSIEDGRDGVTKVTYRFDMIRKWSGEID